MPDIANYAYLWYKTENPFEYIRPDEYEEIFDIVRTFSYPCYLSGGPAIDRLPPRQKEYLLNDEIGFIRARMSEHGIKPDNITIIQIPRVLYDLFVLVYYIQTRKPRNYIVVTCDSAWLDFGNFKKYNQRIAHYLAENKNNILELNHFIIRKIYYIVRGKEPKESYDDTSMSRREQRHGLGLGLGFGPGHAGELGDGDMSPATFQEHQSTKRYLAKEAKKKAKKKAKKAKKTKITPWLDPGSSSSSGSPSSSGSSSSSGSVYSPLAASSAPEPEPMSPFVVLSPKGTLGEPAWLPWEEPSSPLAGVAGVASFKGSKFSLDFLDSPDFPRSPGSPYSDYAPSNATESQPEVIREFLRNLESGNIASFQIILEHILYAEYMFMNSHASSFDTFRLNFTDPVKQIFRVILIYELDRTSPGVTLLYRGAVLANDGLLTKERLIQSTSFNTSGLSGCINDPTACTLFYLERSATFEAIGKQTAAAKNDKIICRLKKFFKGDGSNEDNMFFIPPFPPFLVSFLGGELFHPRTKFNLDYLTSKAYPVPDKEKKDKTCNEIVRGILCSYNFLIGCDYLHSSKSMDELEALYQHFKRSGIIFKFEVGVPHVGVPLTMDAGTYRRLTKKYHSKAGRRRTNKIIKRANRRIYKSTTNKIMKRAKWRTYKSRTNKY